MKFLPSGKIKFGRLLLLTAFFLTLFSACSSMPDKTPNKSKQKYERAALEDKNKKPTPAILEKVKAHFNPPSKEKPPPLLPYQKDLKAARYYTHLQEYLKAEYYLKKTLLQAPDEPSALQLLPWNYFYQGRYDKALRAFERHHAVNPRDPGTLTGMGWCYLGMNNHKQALETFAQAEKYSPDGYEVHKGRAIIYLKQKNPARALPSLEKIYNSREIETLLAFWELEGENMSASSYPVLPDDSGSPSLFTLPVDGPRYQSMLWGLNRPKKKSPELETAWRYYRLKLYRRAVTAFQNLPEPLIQTLDAQNGLAWSYLKTRKIQKADPLFDRIAKTYPKFIGVVKGKMESENLKMRKANFAQYYLDLNKLKIAEKKFDALVEEFPDWPYSYVQLGKIALKINDPEMAQNLFQKALKLDPKNKGGLLGLEALVKIREPGLYAANQAFKNEKYRLAASLYHDYIVVKKPSTPLNESLARAYIGLGWSQYHKGQYRLAIEKFKQSKRHEKFKSDSILGMGLSYFQLKNYKDAVTHLKFARLRQPDESRGIFELDWSVLRSWKNDRVRRYFESEIQNDPLRASLYMGLGWIHYKNHKPDLAVEFFLRAISLDPDSAVSGEFFTLLASQRFGWQVYNRLGWAYYHKSDFNRSLEMFRASLKESPDKSAAHQGIGYNLFQMEKYPAAIKYLEQALTINPASPPVMERGESQKIRTTARTKLGKAYYHSGNYLKAVGYFQKALAVHPHLADARADLGWSYLKLRRLTESRAAFTESLKLAPLKARSHKGLKEVKQLLATGNIRVIKPAFTKISVPSSSKN